MLSELAAKICSWTASPEAEELAEADALALAEAEALADADAEALAEPDADAEDELLPDEQPTSANAATRAMAHTAAKMSVMRFFMYIPFPIRLQLRRPLSERRTTLRILFFFGIRVNHIYADKPIFFILEYSGMKRY